MKKHILNIFVLLISISTFAQQEKAKNLLNEVSENLKSYQTLTFGFEYKLDNYRTGTHQKNNGVVWMNGDKYQLDYLDMTQIYDGEKLYTISEEDEEVTVSKPSNMEEDEMLTPNQILNLYKKGYEISYDIKEKIQGHTVQYIKLIHPRKNQALKYILIGVDMKTKDLYNMIHYDNKGTITTFTINNFKPNTKVSANKFKFFKANYPDYYISEI